MKTRYFVFALIAAAVIGVVGYGAYRAGMSHGMQTSVGATVTATQSTTGAQKPGDVDPATGRKVLYWHDPMVPGQKFDKPGKSPFMDMQLVPVYADGGSASDAGTPFALSGECEAGPPVLAKVELVQGAVAWHTAEVDLAATQA